MAQRMELIWPVKSSRSNILKWPKNWRISDPRRENHWQRKRRPPFDPLIVHIASSAHLKKLVKDIPSGARKLTEKLWPGPLTVVLFKEEHIPDIVTAGLPTVALRMPSHPMALSLIKESKCPIAAPSANPFGYLSPTQ